MVESDKSPEAAEENARSLLEQTSIAEQTAVDNNWGVEKFSSEGTTANNEMSVVQYANLCGQKILLTADAGRSALTEAAHYASAVGLRLPGIDRFQVPHHGSSRNVSTEILDCWLGDILRETEKPEEGTGDFTAIISASKEDDDHPRKAVIRACIHRGGKVISTEDGHKATWSKNPGREGWTTVQGLPYPEEQEEED